MPSEFAAASRFLEGLTAFLEIPRDRVVIVPGNHDINRDSCEAHFKACAADESDPVPPFWAKWKHYSAMFTEFYRELTTRPQFSIEEYWTWYEFKEPGPLLVVTGLNSTVSEIHDIPKKVKNYQRLIASKEYGHFGRVGEAQLWWFKARLDAAKEQGVFRLGVVHHNRHRDPVADDENLRDAALLEQHLGESLNLLLHGHTHNSKIDWVNPHLPVLSTGSAALNKDVRPDQVPNQYQVVRIRPDRLERWTRRFDPGSMRWEADTRCSEDGNSWHVVKKVSFLSVHLTFPKPPPPEMGSRHLLRSHVLRPPPTWPVSCR